MVLSFQESLRIRFLIVREKRCRCKIKEVRALIFVLKHMCVFVYVQRQFTEHARNQWPPSSNDHFWHLEAGSQKVHLPACLGCTKRAFPSVATNSKSTADCETGWAKTWKKEHSLFRWSTWPQNKWKKQDYKPNQKWFPKDRVAPPGLVPLYSGQIMVSV